MEKISCPICKSINNKKPFITLKDRFLLKDKINFTLTKCECDFIFLNPRPTESNISKYYLDKNYTSHNRKSIFYSVLQKLSFSCKESLIKKYIHSKDALLLDYGSGKGEFATYLNNKNYNVDTFEPILKNSNRNNKLVGKKYDLIMLWHSIEHIHDINSALLNICEMLNKKGVLLIACPNIDAIEKKYFNSKWVAYDAPRHLYHFNIKSISSLLDKYSFKVEKIKNMYQDTFYNIYLSSKLTSFSILRFIIVLFLVLIEGLYNFRNKASSYIYICKNIK